MARFDSQIETAQRLIALNGQDVTWRQPASVANPSTPWKPSNGAPTDYPVKIVFLPLDRVGTALLRQLANTELAIGSEYGLMGAVEFEPNLTDTIIRDGKEVRIIAIDVLKPNGQIILYTLQLEE